MLITCTVVGGAVIAALLLALRNAPRSTEQSAPDIKIAFAPERSATRSVWVAGVLSVAGLFGLVVISVLTDRALASLPQKDSLNIQVTAHQWWWDVRYDDPDPSKLFNTANEIHIPVGRTINVTLRSDDVIHSFWVPNLHGKKDLIPGRTGTIQFRADSPGVYRGQCAEFCGYQHAYMAFLVIAEPSDQYEQWAQTQRASAVTPSEALPARGEQVFMSSTCVMCHAIQGTSAQARRAPDLTHLGSRTTLAAGTLTNTQAHLTAWISDPQRFKPGVNMPSADLTDDDLQALSAYLSSLR
jgi:cytochrome c oxidase subunit II